MTRMDQGMDFDRPEADVSALNTPPPCTYTTEKGGERFDYSGFWAILGRWRMPRKCLTSMLGVLKMGESTGDASTRTSHLVGGRRGQRPDKTHQYHY